MARALKMANKELDTVRIENKELRRENAAQKEEIKSFQPVKSYVDRVLSSTGYMTTGQIAKEYGYTAYEMNIMLQANKMICKQNGHWVLTQKYVDKGLAKTETKVIRQRNGKLKTMIILKWTQRGREKIDRMITRLWAQWEHHYLAKGLIKPENCRFIFNEFFLDEDDGKELLKAFFPSEFPNRS